MAKRVKHGKAYNIGQDMVRIVGNNPNITDGVSIGANTPDNLQVNNNEVLVGVEASKSGKTLYPTSNSIKVLSAEPMLGGISPVQLLYGGMPPDKAFAIQEQYKNIHGINDDGSRQHAKYGGENKDSGFKIVKQRTDFQPTKFKTFLRRLYASDNSDSAANRYGDFSRMYFGMPLTDGLLYESNYKPTMAKNPNTKYYGVTDVKFINDVIELYNNPGFLERPHTGVVDGYATRGPKSYSWEGEYLSDDVGRDLADKKKVKMGKTPLTLGPGALGRFTVSRGKDDKGEYLSYYDLWDVAPERSHKAEKRGFAKAYEIYDRIYGTFDENGVFTPNGQINPSIITADKKQFGGQINKQSLGERPNANFEKDMKNKRNKAAYGGDLKTIAEINAAKKQLGKYYSVYYNDDGSIKQSTPTFRSLQGQTLTANQQQLYRGLMGQEGYNNLFNPSGIFRDNITAITPINIGTKPFTDKYGTIINPNGSVASIKVPETGLSNPKSVSTTTTPKSSGLSALGADLIGAGINTIGSLIAAGINQNAINKQTFTPRQYNLLNPVKLKTKININPQLGQMRETVAKISDAARRTSASSRNAYQKIANARLAGLNSIMDLYGNKENKETQLINQDRLNQQQIAAQNANRVMDVINYNATGRDDLNNRKSMLTAQNWINPINVAAGTVAGPQGLLARRDARRNTAANLAMMSLAYPDAARMIMSGDGWRKAFDGYYDMLNNKVRV